MLAAEPGSGPYLGGPDALLRAMDARRPVARAAENRETAAWDTMGSRSLLERILAGIRLQNGQEGPQRSAFPSQ